MVFAGHYEHAIDEKNRLSIPSKLRARWNRDRDGDGFYVVPGRQSGTLWLYTERHFEALSEFAESSLIPDQNQLDFDEIYFPLAEFVELDGQGRILLPDRMVRRSEIGREVVISGVRDHVEIWRREDFEKRLDERWTRFHEIQQKAREAYKQAKRQPGREAGET